METADRRTPPQDGFWLLRDEIDRIKKHIVTEGESPVMLERLKRLELMLELCLAP
ncbi:hypothetical protein LJC60_10875 [Ruminococcaceae bacterium OttesenSCG-928-D13]|nr:hypothetical protein [Ruminococcaceae bacterium OttesenSCG-928-D13]